MSRGGSEGQKRSGGVNYGAVLDRRVDDARHERERAYKESIREKGASSLQEKPSAMSSTFDAFQRMAAGLEPRTLQDIMSNPNRPTWEEYKKENESKLDLVGTDMRKMAEYRAQLDRDREGMLSGGKRKASAAISDSEDEVGGKKKSKKKKEKKKKGKKKSSSKKSKDKKSSRDRRSSSSSDSSESDGVRSAGDEPVRLSEFLKQGH